MKRLSYHALFLSLLLVICGSGTPRKTAPQHRDIFYYWFNYPDDYYVDYDDVGDEINTLENELGVIVNQISAGGTLVERGYINDYEPHNVWPSALLYAHY